MRSPTSCAGRSRAPRWWSSRAPSRRAPTAASPTGSPGAGYGGSCFPEDTRALYYLSREQGCPSILMDAVDRINAAQKRVLADKVRKHYGPALAGKTLAIWGLAFKPRTDDIREAPAL